jgi:carbonic anhydrase
MLPKDRDYYRFNGSLTTPPCSEGGRWFVIKRPATASEGQIEQFSRPSAWPTIDPFSRPTRGRSCSRRNTSESLIHKHQLSLQGDFQSVIDDQ